MKSFKLALKQKHFQWAFDYKEVPNRVIAMSDDLDSLISCCFYSYLTGYPIEYFYDFSSMSAIEPKDTRERIYIDIAVRQGKCIDNHVQRITLKSKVNNEAINFNSIYEICSDNYFDKFAMSTLIMLYATYRNEMPLPLSELGKMVVLSQDSGYMGFYNEDYKEAFIHNLKELGLEELLEVLENRTLEEFEKISNELKSEIGTKIGIKKGKLYFFKFEGEGKEKVRIVMDSEKVDKRLGRLSELLGFPIALPKDTFEVISFYRVVYATLNEAQYHLNNDEVFSYALTGKDKVKLSIRLY